MELTVKKPSAKMKISKKFKGTRIDGPLQAYYIFLDSINDDSGAAAKEYQAILLDNDNTVECEVFFPIKKSNLKKDFLKMLQLAKKWNLSKVFLGEANFSKNILPSSKQSGLAKQFKELARALNISLVDQLILSERSYFSFAENGLK